MSQYQKIGVTLLRVAVALQMIIHGVTRIVIGGVDGFGVFLGANHIPLGTLVAWAITVVEITGGLALAVGFFVVPLSGWFAFELLMGIAFVHFKEGWFVVGAGRNGMEYSIVLIAALASIALTHFQKSKA